MTLSESAKNEIMSALENGNGGDLVHQLAQLGMQELIEAEATEVIGADKWERTIDRVTHRNGHRPRTLSTTTGDMQLAIPKFDRGSFFPEVLEPRRRIDQAMHAVVMEAYVHGVSTRSVDKLVAALGVDTGISKSEVSRICARRTGRRVPQSDTRPHDVPVRLSRRHLCPRPRRRTRPGCVPGCRCRHWDYC